MKLPIDDELHRTALENAHKELAEAEEAVEGYKKSLAFWEGRLNERKAKVETLNQRVLAATPNSEGKAIKSFRSPATGKLEVCFDDGKEDPKPAEPKAEEKTES